MEKLNVVIADDDYLMIQNLLKLIDWKKLGFEVSATASDGKEALKFIRKNHPEVLITDVIMPVMDGLELISQVRQEFPDMKILILSSYDEFGYVKKAIAMGVADYILKSEITEMSFSAKLSMLYQQCFSQRFLTSTAINQELSYYFESGKPYGSLEELPYLKELYQKKYQFFVFSQAVSFETDAAHMVNTWKSSSSLLFSIVQEMEDFRHAPILFTWHHYCIAGTALETGKQNRQYLLDSMSRKFLYYVNSKADHPCSLFYSCRLLTPPELLRFFRHNQNLLSYYSYFPELVPIDFEKIEASFTEDFTVKEFDFQALSFSPEHLEEDIFRMRDFLVRCFSQKNARALSDFFRKFSSRFTPGNSLYFQTPEYFQKWVFNTYELQMKQISSPSGRKLNLSTEKAIAFIETHFSDCSLSVRDISDHVALSEGRLGVLFKTDTGKTVNEYLTDVRIKNAEFLLGNTNMKIYEIADRCGYKSSQYFSQIFYQKTGRRPIDYRRSN